MAINWENILNYYRAIAGNRYVLAGFYATPCHLVRIIWLNVCVALTCVKLYNNCYHTF